MRPTRLIGLVALGLAVIAACPQIAAGSFPGRNGPLALAVQGCESSSYLASMPWRGGDLTPLSPQCDRDFQHMVVHSPGCLRRR